MTCPRAEFLRGAPFGQAPDLLQF